MVFTQMITVIVQFIKEYKRFILALIVIVPALLIGCYIYMLQADNSSYKSHLQSAKNENRQLLDEKTQLVNSFKEQLESIKDINQQLLEEKKEKEKENDRINVELQSIKDNNQRLLKENKEFQKKIDEFNVELHSVKSNNQKLLEEKKEFQKQINQINAELQSTKESSQEVLKEKIRLLENREVYSTQVRYIQKWMEPIEKLEEHIHAVIHCSESKKKGSKSKFCGKISYDYEESSTGKIITTAIDLIMKFKKECSPFWDALSLNKVAEMKALQASTPLSSFKIKMEQFNEEVSGYKYQKKKEEKDTRDTREHDFDEHQWNKEKGVAKQGIISTIGSALYGFGKWVGSVIVGLFWS